MQKPAFLLAAMAATLTLAACEQKVDVISSKPADPLAEAKKKAPLAELPPPIRASKSFRCKDNSLVFIDFFQGDKLANVRLKEDGPLVQLKAANAGEPLVADGYSLTGNESGIEITVPGKAKQSCKA